MTLPHQRSSCTCTGPPPGPDDSASFESKGDLLLAGAANVAASYIPGIPNAGPLRRTGEGMIGVALIMFGLDFASDLASIAMAHENLHPWDIRNETPQRRAALTQAVTNLHVQAANLPTDPVESITMHEAALRLLADNPHPDDPCGWYRFGWDTHNHLMEAIATDVGFPQALALATARDDAPALMRLVGIPTAEISCRRFWFGFRDANAALAESAAATTA